MAVLTVFSDNLNPTTGSLTTRFTQATGFYIDVPFLTVEMEIDVFLQVYFPTATGERVRNLPLGKLKDGEIKLNETDSETLISIPYEFVDSGLEMALFFLSSDTTYLDVYVVGADCTLCEIKSSIEQLQNANSLTQQILELILNFLGISTPFLPAAPPTSAQSSFFFLQ